jgi:protein SCO1/2
MVLQSPDTLTDFTLTSADGKVSLSDLRGKVVLIYFGYTFCPDVCPATMVELKKAMNDLGRDSEDVQVVMISLDPLRDTPEILQSYVQHFHPSFMGLTGTDEEISAITVPMGIFYEKHEGSPESGYLIDHTATVVVVDKDGYLRLIYSFDTPGEDMAKDLRYLVRD